MTYRTIPWSIFPITCQLVEHFLFKQSNINDVWHNHYYYASWFNRKFDVLTIFFYYA